MKTDKHIHTETATVAQRNSVAHDGIMRAQEQRMWCERSGRELLMCLFTPKIESRARRCDESITELAPVDLHSHVLLIQCEEFQDQLSSIRIKLLLRFFSSRHTDVWQQVCPRWRTIARRRKWDFFRSKINNKNWSTIKLKSFPMKFVCVSEHLNGLLVELFKGSKKIILGLRMWFSCSH